MTPPFAILGHAKIPFLLALVLYYALNHPTGTMLGAALVAGFLGDALSPVPMGYSAALFCAAGLVAGRYRKLVVPDSLMTAVVFGAVAGGIMPLVFWGLLTRASLVSASVGWVLLKALGTAVLGALAAVVCFLLLNAMDRMVGNTGPRDVAHAIE
jgi:rod shape-determining protein MreD